MTEAESVRHIENSVLAWDRILLYFTRADCSLCHRLRPRISRLGQRYPDMEVLHVDLDRMPGAAGRYLVFDVPGVVVYISGKPMARFIGGVDYQQLRQVLDQSAPE